MGAKKHLERIRVLPVQLAKVFRLLDRLVRPAERDQVQHQALAHRAFLGGGQSGAHGELPVDVDGASGLTPFAKQIPYVDVSVDVIGVDPHSLGEGEEGFLVVPPEERVETAPERGLGAPPVRGEPAREGPRRPPHQRQKGAPQHESVDPGRHASLPSRSPILRSSSGRLRRDRSSCFRLWFSRESRPMVARPFR